MQEQTTSTVETVADAAPAARVYGGITRLPYWLGTIGLLVLNFLMGAAARSAKSYSPGACSGSSTGPPARFQAP